MNKDTIKIARAARILAAAAGTDLAKNKRVADAWALIDNEKITSLPGLVAAFRQKRATIEADRALSDVGKREQITAFAKSQLGNVATKARRVVELEAEHANDKASAVPIPKADAADVLLDLALVQYVREKNPIPSRLVEMSERVRLAVARTPVELSGITGSVRAQVHGSLMSPEKAVQLAAEADALGAAREVTQAAIEEVARHAEWTPAELVQHFGSSWRLPGVASTLAERLAGEGE